MHRKLQSFFFFLLPKLLFVSFVSFCFCKQPNRKFYLFNFSSQKYWIIDFSFSLIHQIKSVNNQCALQNIHRIRQVLTFSASREVHFHGDQATSLRMKCTTFRTIYRLTNYHLCLGILFSSSKSINKGPQVICLSIKNFIKQKY